MWTHTASHKAADCSVCEYMSLGDTFILHLLLHHPLIEIPLISIVTNRMACEHPDIISAAISVGGPLEVTYNHPCPDMLP